MAMISCLDNAAGGRHDGTSGNKARDTPAIDCHASTMLSKDIVMAAMPERGE